MKSILLFIFISLISYTGFSQFNRSYANALPTSDSFFSNYFHINDENKKLFTNMYITTAHELIITTQEIDDEGEVVKVEKYTYIDSLFTNDKKYINSISGIFDQGLYRYYIFIIESGFSVKLAWMKTDIATGDLIDLHVSGSSFLIGYIETKLIGDEMVTYISRGAKLERKAMSISNFGALTTEDVVTHNYNAYDIQKGKKMGSLLVLDGEEYYFNTETSNDYHMLIFKRESQNQYTQITFNPNYHFRSIKGTVVFLNDDNHFVITDGEIFNIIDAEGNYVNTIDLEMDLTLGMDINFVFFKDQKYYIIYTSVTSSTSTLLVVDKGFNKLEKKVVDQVYVNRIVEHEEKYYLDGIVSGIGKRTRIPEAYIPGYPPYLECFEESPILWFEEYFNPLEFQNSDLNMNIGLGSRTFTSYGGYHAMKYKNEQILCRQLADNYLGLDSDNTIFGNTHILGFGTSEIAGPCTNYDDYDEVEEAKYNRYYHITSQMIADHLDSVQNGSSNYIPVWEIRRWPGNGDPSKGQAKKLADFVDQNNNGIYEPLQGDYPLIYGDECVFSITHYWDLGNESQLLEFHSYIYHFDCDTTSTFRNVLFRKLNVISRGADLSEFYMGTFQESAIGDNRNDYIGTNVDLGMTYFYNGTLVDNTNYGFKGFDNRLAATGTMILKGFKAKDNGIDDDFGVEGNESINGLGFGDGIIDNEYNGLAYSVPYYAYNTTITNYNGLTPAFWGSPNNYVGWINNFKGLTGAGNPTTYGGLGYDGTVSTKYMFPWEHDIHDFGTNGIQPPFENWSETNTDGSGTSNDYGDRKLLSSFGETSLSSGDTISIDYAFLFVRDTVVSPLITSPLTLLFEKGEAVRNAFLTNDVSCDKNFDGLIVKMPKKKPFITGQLNIFPNPSNGQVKITGISDVNEINIYAMNGALVKKIKDYQIGEVIDLYHLRGGVYFFQIEDEYQNVIKKVVKI